MAERKGRKAAELFLSFFKIGLFTFGSGYAMISLIDSECVDRKKWISREELLDVTAIAESTPGPIAVNCATYVGYRTAATLGAVSATIGVVLPSLIIIYLISLFYDEFRSIGMVSAAFRGISAAVGIIIISAAFKLMKSMGKDAVQIVVFSVTAAAEAALMISGSSFSMIYMILIAAAAGAAAFALGRRKKHR